MPLIYIVVSLSIIALGIFILVKIEETRALQVGIILFLFSGLLGFAIFEYASNHQFRLFIDLRFNSAREHISLGETAAPLPLPSKTAFAYRYSTNGCAYYTEKSEEEILSYYTNLVNNVSIINDKGAGQTIIKLSYRENNYLVTVKTDDSQKGIFFGIESVR